MSKRLPATEERVRELEVEVAQWRAAYKELALAIARRDGYGAQPDPLSTAVAHAGRVQYEEHLRKAFALPGDGMGPGPGQPALPSSVLAAIEDTTAPFSDARTMAIEAARALLESGAQPEAVEAQLRRGEEIIV